MNGGVMSDGVMTMPAAVRIPVVVVLALLLTAASPAAAAPAPAPPNAEVVAAPAGEAWEWPVSTPFRVDRPFVAPAHEYGPGHRGVDILPLGELGDRRLRSPADGVVAFVGAVAGRGVITIDHGDGLVTTLEPVTSSLTAGTPVARGEEVAALGSGGHTQAGRFHFGVRRDGEYINPLLLLGGVPRAVLLPCC